MLYQFKGLANLDVLLQKHLFKLMIVFIFFVSHFISYFTTQSTSLLWAITCTHIWYMGEVCTMIFPFPFPFESKVDFVVHCVRTFWSQIGKGQRTSLLIFWSWRCFWRPITPYSVSQMFCFENTDMIFSAFLLIGCSSNYGGGIILTLNNRKVAIACFFFRHSE